jgi:hypothetical protein
MKLNHLQARRASSRFLITACVVLLCLLSLASRFHATRPRVWKPAEVRVAFWSWRNETPTQAEVERAVNEAHALTLFLRAGQIDVANEALKRIRPASGVFPQGIELHLVYNATPALLTNFERLDAASLASVISETYKQDAARAAHDGALVAGLQLDLDVPTRLLTRYAQTLRLVRAQLPPRTRLSITGLPTWVDSAHIDAVLASVDFWTPQCYGAIIPDELQKRIPIASAAGIAQTITRVRSLNHPFYAGIPAYGYALLYSPSGKLINLRGDLDPTLIARDRNFELIERSPFETRAQTENQSQAQSEAQDHVDDKAHSACEWRYVYRALADGVTDGLAVHAGDVLVFDLPSAEAFSAYARAVREEAGDKLLGICVFRLSGREDATTLALEQIAAALADVPLQTKTDVSINQVHADKSGNPDRVDKSVSHASVEATTERGGGLNITAVNRGTTSALLGADALVLTLRVPAGSLREVASLDGFTGFETLCARDERSAPRPCGLLRANILRLKARSWMAGATGQARIIVQGKMPDALDANIATLVDDGRMRESNESVSVTTGERR